MVDFSGTSQNGLPTTKRIFQAGWRRYKRKSKIVNSNVYESIHSNIETSIIEQICIE